MADPTDTAAETRQWSAYRHYEGRGFTITVIAYTVKKQGP